jgi:lipopolysaccharide transport system permease protein
MVLTELRTLFRYRNLIAALTSRDLKARYRGSVLGFFWSLANPLLLLGVYTLVFTKFFPARGPNPYPIFLFAGILPWTFFSASILESTTAISGNSGLVKKVMFPAETLPMVVVLSHLVHFLLALPILLAAIAIAVIAGLTHASAAMLIAPLIMLLQTVFIAGIALIVSSASVLFRDLRDLIANLLQLGFFLTPILYSVDSITSAPLKIALRLNPMTPFASSYQAIFFHGRPPQQVDVALMLLYAVVSLAAGAFVFDRLRDTLAEAI